MPRAAIIAVSIVLVFGLVISIVVTVMQHRSEAPKPAVEGLTTQKGTSSEVTTADSAPIKSEQLLSVSLNDFLDRSSLVEPVLPLNVEGFFHQEVGVPPPLQNLTFLFKAQSAQPGAKTLIDFVKAQPLITTLPMVRPEEVHLSRGEFVEVETVQYLTMIRSSAVLTMAAALQSDLDQLISTNNTQPLAKRVADLEAEKIRLRSAVVPAMASDFHRLFIGYTERTLLTLRAITQWQEDRVGGLLAIRQLDALDKQYTKIIREELNRLNNLSTVAL